MEELLEFVALSRVKGLNNIEKREIVTHYDSIAPLFEGKSRLRDGDLRNRLATFTAWRELERELKELEKMGVSVLTLRDPTYPELLRNIPDPPIVLYKKGQMHIGTPTIGIVGSRKATFEGMNLAEKIAHTLSSLGVSVVSGLARGIDASAHKGALKEKGKTVGVLGCGIDICYPPENRWLFAKIGEEGAILTEYPLGERPFAGHFPERNRIIAGLSMGILVVEASQRSGALITARLGLEYGREVMAIPGSIFTEEHKGANNLIKQGAKLVDDIQDVIATCFPGLEFKREEPAKMSTEEDCIYSLIGFEKTHVNEVIEKSRMETKRVMATITGLEMKEAIRGIPGGFYIRN